MAEKPKPTSCWQPKRPFVAFNASHLRASSTRTFSPSPRYEILLVCRLLCTSADPLPRGPDRIPLETELNYPVPLLIKLILDTVQLLVSGVISLGDTLMHAVLACVFSSGHPSLPAWIVNLEKITDKSRVKEPRKNCFESPVILI